MNLTSVVELFTDHRRIAYSTREAFGATNHKLRQSERRLRSPYTLKNYYFNEDVAKARSDLALATSSL